MGLGSGSGSGGARRRWETIRWRKVLIRLAARESFQIEMRNLGWMSMSVMSGDMA